MGAAASPTIRVWGSNGTSVGTSVATSGTEVATLWVGTGVDGEQAENTTPRISTNEMDTLFIENIILLLLVVDG
jgi:hypothetical protein